MEICRGTSNIQGGEGEMAYYWLVWKVYSVTPNQFQDTLGDVDGFLPIYRTKKAAQKAHGYAVEMSKLETEFSKKGLGKGKGK